MTEHHYTSTIATTKKSRTDSYFTSHTNNKIILSIHESTSLYDLREVIQQYQAQPELLKLILTSKVEEDKRRAEEAKLRAKELDIYLRHGNQIPNSPTTTPRLSISPDITESSSSKTNNHYRGAPYVISTTTANDNTFRNYHSSISPTSSEKDEDKTSRNMDHHHYHQRRHSAAAAMLAMGKSVVEKDIKMSEKSTKEEEAIPSAYPTPVADHYTDEQEEFTGNNNKPRRRREMQAITKIVETRESPYVDNYFWKNNGNTVQKKTGCKSIYFKCSNSNKKGCSVNKTVIARPNGEYLIKYRGCHLPECGRVEIIRDL